MTREIPEVWVVTGGPAAGKSTVLDILCDIYREQGTPITPLDPDVTYGDYNRAMLELNGLSPGDYESTWFQEHIKPRNYDGIIDTARFARERGCPVVVVAPFTSQTRSKEKWHSVVDALGGGPVHMAYVLTDSTTLISHLKKRGAPPDLAKLENLSNFLTRIDLDTPPTVEHFTIDNRQDADVPLRVQVAEMLAKTIRSN